MEAVFCGAVELYCVIPQGVSIIIFHINEKKLNLSLHTVLQTFVYLYLLLRVGTRFCAEISQSNILLMNRVNRQTSLNMTE